jgi:serine/threonine protein kinase
MMAQGTRLGPYEIVAPLGAGGMGEVYKARDTRLNRTVAIKILPADVASDPQRRERFRREARAISSLTHPHICTLHDVGEQDGIDFLVMEYLAGETLAHRLLRGALPLDDVLRIAGQLADALDGAHREGIVHRDLKPANVVLAAGGAKVLDFGLAKWHSGGPDSSISAAQVTANPTLTQLGSVAGTVQYMAPEQVEGKPVDTRTDLFALGAIIYEMTTGRKAFEGTSSTTVMAAILTSTPAPMSTLQPITPPALERVVRKCLAKDPAKRWQTAADLRDALAWIADDAFVPAGPSTTRKTPAVGHRAKLAVVAPMAVLALAAATYIGMRWRSMSTASAPPSSIDDLQITQLTSTGNAFWPAISPDGKDVAYIQRDGDVFSLWRRQVDSTSQVQIVPPEQGTRIIDATVTPDGGFVDFIRRHAGPAELWRVPFLGGTARKMVDGVNSAVGWSPDGQRMAFLRSSDTSSYELLIADRDASHERMVAKRRSPGTFSNFLFRPDWSPDGRSVALLGTGSPGLIQRRLVVVDVATGAERVLPLPIFYGDVFIGLGWLDQGSLVVNRASELGAPTQLWRLSYPG